jgi:hypothetical protein
VDLRGHQKDLPVKEEEEMYALLKHSQEEIDAVGSDGWINNRDISYTFYCVRPAITIKIA